ncbi:hypothetical protein HSRCO_0295 [Halanaeroarchaeum sp. HSR-CO]|uniref:DUF7389 domain-containing protein n=1 Tax=Halanaeroarchaeum sp. HSR-CO TaxID=2866382 RepID=UPI00217DE2B7|nr:hypothetical protein [Halanaeroarchaeum sp. HSR-CO]UWG46594.1 hypothetical protein HSRCO_0295 [Halanaeroarchaeum sp. HSR-CO]
MSDAAYQYEVKLSRGNGKDDRDEQKVKVSAETIEGLREKVENARDELEAWAADYREIQPTENRHRITEDQSELGEAKP